MNCGAMLKKGRINTPSHAMQSSLTLFKARPSGLSAAGPWFAISFVALATCNRVASATTSLAIAFLSISTCRAAAAYSPPRATPSSGAPRLMAHHRTREPEPRMIVSDADTDIDNMLADFGEATPSDLDEAALDLVDPLPSKPSYPESVASNGPKLPQTEDNISLGNTHPFSQVASGSSPLATASPPTASSAHEQSINVPLNPNTEVGFFRTPIGFPKVMTVLAIVASSSRKTLDDFGEHSGLAANSSNQYVYYKCISIYITTNSRLLVSLKARGFPCSSHLDRRLTHDFLTNVTS